MPTYDYRCDDCDNVFEEFHGMTEDPEVECPACGGKTKKLIGGGLGVIFKGSGFYINDSNSRSNASTSIGSSSNQTTDSSSDSASDTKKPASSSVSAEKKEPVKSAAG